MTGTNKPFSNSACTLALTNPKKRLAFAISKGMQTLPSPSSDWKRRWKSCTLLTTRSLVLGHSSVEQQDVCAQQAEAFSWLLACGFVRDKVVSTKSDHVNGRIGPSKWWCTIFYTIKIDKTMRRTQFYTIRAALIVPTKSDLVPVLLSADRKRALGCVHFQNFSFQILLFIYHIKSFTSCMEY